MKILIVEDDQMSANILQKALQPLGRCEVAPDGRAGQKAVMEAFGRGERYGLVCLDIMMPEASGREVLTYLRAEEDRRGIQGLDRTKVIMVSGVDDKGNVLGAFREGCEAYLVKPLDRALLTKTLVKLNLLPG